jgi:hypothetical protein
MVVFRKFKSLCKVLRRRREQYVRERAYLKSEDYVRLHALKAQSSGDVAFLIGNGPSVKIEDLDQLVGRCSFCCNRFYLAYDQMEFRPTFTLSGDRQVVDDFGADIVDHSGNTVIFTTDENPKISHSLWLPSVSNGSRLVLANDRLARITPGGGTLIAAIQIGYFLGIRKFVLYGVDHNFNFKKEQDAEDEFRSASGDENHFIKGYRSGKSWCPPAMQLIEDSFSYADEMLRQEGGFLVNATRGGKLEVLERVELEDAIQL